VIKSEICNNFDPIFINSDYYCNLLNLLKNVLQHDVDASSLLDKIFLNMLLKFFAECHNKQSLYYLLKIVFHLSEDK
jgi:hypothetical protein